MGTYLCVLYNLDVRVFKLLRLCLRSKSSRAPLCASFFFVCECVSFVFIISLLNQQKKFILIFFIVVAKRTPFSYIYIYLFIFIDNFKSSFIFCVCVCGYCEEKKKKREEKLIQISKQKKNKI
jgi:hypothetical protein